MDRYVDTNYIGPYRYAEEIIIKAIEKGLFRTEKEIKTIQKLLNFIHKSKEFAQ